LLQWPALLLLVLLLLLLLRFAPLLRLPLLLGSNDRAVGMPVVVQRHVPTIQRMLTLEDSRVQYIVSTTTPTVMCETAHRRPL